MAATNIPIEAYSGRLPLNYSDTWKNTFRTMIRRMRGRLANPGVIVGKKTGISPTYDAGPWWIDIGFGLQNWRVWDVTTGGYVPTIKQVANASASITFAAKPSVAQFITVPNASGTVALLSDVYVPRATVILTGSNPAISWSASDNFFILLTANTTFTFTGSSDGNIITVTVENLGTEWTATWPVAVKWPAGGAEPPVPMGSGVGGGAAIGIYTFRDINGVIYGQLEDASPANATATIHIGGQPPTNYGGGGNDPGGNDQANLY